MTPKQIERVAYTVAHQILTLDLAPQELACPGARRSREIDTIAGLVQGALERALQLEYNNRPERVARQDLMLARSTSLLVHVPQQLST